MMEETIDFIKEELLLLLTSNVDEENFLHQPDKERFIMVHSIDNNKVQVVGNKRNYDFEIILKEIDD